MDKILNDHGVRAVPRNRRLDFPQLSLGVDLFGQMRP
jgi:hypothetical protein